jgi:hypothetical protein
MSESKIKYLKLLKTQYHSGQISKRKYNRELRICRGEKSILDIIQNFLGII